MKQHFRTTKRKTQRWLSKSDPHQPENVKLTLSCLTFLSSTSDGFCIEERCVEKSGGAVGSSQYYVFSGFSLLVGKRMMKFEFRPVLPAGLPSSFREDPP